MANWQDPQTTGAGAATVSVPLAARDVGLRSYMLSVYNYMASGVLLTGIVALLLVNSPLIRLVVDPTTGRPTFLPLIALFASLGVGMWLQAGIMRMVLGTAKTLFFAYAALLGIAGFATVTGRGAVGGADVLALVAIAAAALPDLEAA